MKTTVAAPARPWVQFYEPGVPDHLKYPDLTLGGILEETARKFPDHPALLFYGKKISYAELDRLASRFANAQKLAPRRFDTNCAGVFTAPFASSSGFVSDPKPRPGM